MSDDLVKRARRLDTCIFPTERSKCLCGEAADRIEKLEAALGSVLRYQLTDETWGMLGFDPKTIRAEFNAARKALDAE